MELWRGSYRWLVDERLKEEHQDPIGKIRGKKDNQGTGREKARCEISCLESGKRTCLDNSLAKW